MKGKIYLVQYRQGFMEVYHTSLFATMDIEVAQAFVSKANTIVSRVKDRYYEAWDNEVNFELPKWFGKRGFLIVDNLNFLYTEVKLR